MGLSILVCIKAVPEPTAGDIPLFENRWIDEDGLAWRMNPYDACALEAALSIKDANDDVFVTALSAGPERVGAVIRRAMAMGADTGVHLAMETDGRPAAGSVASAISDYAGLRDVDLILTGAVSEDLMQGITGPMIAAALNWPCAAAATAVVADMVERSLTVDCEMEGGASQRVRMALPALVTVQTAGRQPRYPSLSNTLRSRKAAIERVVYRSIDPPALSPATIHIARPQPQTICRVIEGTAAEKADALLRLFNDEGLLR